MSAWKMLAREVSQRRRKTEEAEERRQKRGGDQESPWAEDFQEPHCKVSALIHFLPLGPLRTKALCKCGG